MAIALPLIAFVFLFLIRFRTLRSVTAAITDATLFLSLFVLSGTELLSLMTAFNYPGLSVFWSATALILAITFGMNYRDSFALMGQHFRQIAFSIRDCDKPAKVFLAAGAVILLGVLVQGLLYPPNNWDSLTYHLGRIVHWVANETVAHYPTNIYRQIYQPPFSEFFIAGVNVLARSDLLANAVQWFYLLALTCAAAALGRRLGLSAQGRLVAALILLTTPEIILEASTTKNDVVLSFFIVAATGYAIDAYSSESVKSYLLLGLAAGLACLTKGTAYIYLFPVIVAWAAANLSKQVRRSTFAVIPYVLACLCFLAVNTGHYARNYQLTDSLLGSSVSPAHSSYANSGMSVSAFLSNVSRNIALHYHLYPISEVVSRGVVAFHSLIHEDINNRKTTWGESTFRMRVASHHEDFASNIFQASLFLLCCVLLFVKRKSMDKKVVLLFMVLVVQFGLFCLYLKWQPWHSRLHTPLFALSSVVVASLLVLCLDRKWTYILLSACFVYAFLVLLFNYSRPFINVPPATLPVSIFDARDTKYFALRPHLAGDYREVRRVADEIGCTKIGLELTEDSWEYPIFSSIYTRKVLPVHINVHNISKRAMEATIDPKCIISERMVDPFLYNGRVFRGKTDGNRYLFLYEREK